MVRPLTAAHHFPAMFRGPWHTVLMSATIGDLKTFTKELGIKEGTYNGIAVPNRFPAHERRIIDLEAPRLSYRSEQKDYEAQADVIAEMIKKCPESWPGLIHVTRIKEAPLLRERLVRRGISRDRLYVPETMSGRFRLGTQEQIEQWHRHLNRVPNAIMICWQFWEGLDGQRERINVICKVPFPSLGDPYEIARQKFSRSWYQQRTAYDLVQAYGRTRRGKAEHYDTGGMLRGLVAIADGNWTRIKSKLPAEIKEAMYSVGWVEWSEQTWDLSVDDGGIVLLGDAGMRGERAKEKMRLADLDVPF